MRYIEVDRQTFVIGYGLHIATAMNEDYNINLHSETDLVFSSQEQRDAAFACIGSLLNGYWEGYPGTITVTSATTPHLLLTDEDRASFSEEDVKLRRTLRTAPTDLNINDWFNAVIMAPILQASGYMGHYQGTWVFQAGKDDEMFSENWAAFFPGCDYDSDRAFEHAGIITLGDETQAEAIARYIRRGWLDGDTEELNLPEDYDSDIDDELLYPNIK